MYHFVIDLLYYSKDAYKAFVFICFYPFLQLREFVMQLQTLVGRGCSKEDLHIAKIKMMTEVRDMV